MRARASHIGSLVIGSMMVACLTGVPQAGGQGQAAPQWNVGDTWRVGAWHGQVFRPDKRPQTGTYKMKGRMVSVTFEVTGTETVGGTQCHVVKVTFPAEETGFQRLYQVYYATDTGKLIRVLDVSVRPDGSTKNIATDYPADSQGPTFVDSVSSLVPLDWPNLARENVVSPSNAVQATIPGTAQSPDGTVQPQDEVMLTKSSGRNDAKVVQHWRQGETWWRDAKKYKNGQLVSEAVLLEVNGHRIADAQ